MKTNAEQLFNSYYRPLCLYALHYVKDADAAEDVVQECFVRLLEARVEPANARSWLYAATRNRCIDLLRRSQPTHIALPKDLEGAISDEEAQQRSVSEAALWAAIAALPTRQRQVLLMAKRDGMSYREIACRMGISEKTVEHQLANALKKLRKQRDTLL